MISDVVSVVGSHVHCGYWQQCRMNSWCNRISYYIKLLSSLWHEGFHSKRWLKNSGPSDTPAAAVAAGKAIVAFSAMWWLVGVAAACNSRQWALLLPCCCLSWINPLFAQSYPFLQLKGREGEYGERCVVYVHCWVLCCLPWGTGRRLQRLKLGCLLWKGLAMFPQTKFFSAANPHLLQGGRNWSAMAPVDSGPTASRCNQGPFPHQPHATCTLGYRGLLPPFLQQQKEAEMKAGLSLNFRKGQNWSVGIRREPGNRSTCIA